MSADTSYSNCVTVEPGAALLVGNAGGCGSSFPAITLTLADGGTVESGGEIGLYTSNSCDEGGDSTLAITGGTLTNAGTIDASLAGTPSINASGGFRYIEGNVTNTGTMEVNDVTFFEDGTFDNEGSFTVCASGNCSATLQSGESFSNGVGGSIVDQTAAGQTPGTFTQDGGTFTEGAGTTSGPSVAVSGVTLDYTGSGASDIVVTGSSTLEGASSAGQVLEAQGGSGLDLSAPGGFTNGGTINFDSGAGVATFGIGSGHALTNMGTLETIASPGPEEDTNVVGSVVNRGKILASVLLTFTGPGTFENKGSITTSANWATAVNGGELFTNGAGGSIVDQTAAGQTPGTFTQDGGTFTEGAGTTSGPSVVVSGVTLDYTGSGASDIVVTGSSTLEGASSARQVLEAQGGSGLDLSAPGGFTNAGTINFDSGAGEATLSIGSGHALTNKGTLEASASPGPSEDTTIGGAGSLDNQGTLAANGAILTLTHLTNLSSGTLTGGSYEVSGNEEIQLPGSVTTLAAHVQQDDSSTFNGAFNDLTAIATGGSLTLDNGANLAVPGGFSNSGVISLGSSDSLSVTGPYTQAATGRLSVDIAGTGAGSSYGRLAVSGTATLSGTLAITKGYAPSKGDTQQPVTYSSRAGRFSSVTGTGAGNGLSFVLQYTSSAAQVVVTHTTLAVSPASGAPGSTVHLTGRGFSPGETVSLSFKDVSGTVLSLPAAVAGGGGKFTASETVPASAASGAGKFEATGQTSGVAKTAAFTVS